MLCKLKFCPIPLAKMFLNLTAAMAATALTSKDSVECGYCLVRDVQLVDPRILPCNHVSCYPCLEGEFDTNQVVRCGKCR